MLRLPDVCCATPRPRACAGDDDGGPGESMEGSESGSFTSGGGAGSFTDDSRGRRGRGRSPVGGLGSANSGGERAGKSDRRSSRGSARLSMSPKPFSLLRSGRCVANLSQGQDENALERRICSARGLHQSRLFSVYSV